MRGEREILHNRKIAPNFLFVLYLVVMVCDITVNSMIQNEDDSILHELLFIYYFRENFFFPLLCLFHILLLFFSLFSCILRKWTSQAPKCNGSKSMSNIGKRQQPTTATIKTNWHIYSINFTCHGIARLHLHSLCLCIVAMRALSFFVDVIVVVVSETSE